MMIEDEFVFQIRTYKKKELAHLYCPDITERCAIRTLTRWIRRNKELYAALLHTGYTPRARTFSLSRFQSLFAIWMNLKL